MSSTRGQAGEGGLSTTLGAAVVAGAIVGFWSGLIDGVVAGVRTSTEGLVAWAGTLGAAVASYAVLWAIALVALGMATHVWLVRIDGAARTRRLASIGLGLAFALQLYWWSREHLFYGVSSLDPRRLAVAAGALAAGLALGFVALRLGSRAPTAARRAVVVLVPLLALGGAAFMLAERARSEQRGELNERNRGLPNVLLIVVDALRADTLGCYGHPRVKSPVIDRLASRGVLFENALCQAPFTWSSFGSILTGKYPRRHGLVKMAPGVRMPANVTMPWHLKSAKLEGGGTLTADDYTTAAFMTGTLSHGSGLARGFDSYFEALVGHELVEVESAWSVFRSELLLSILWNKLKQRVDDASVASEARAWLEDHATKRFAVKLHLYSTHTPYDPPARFRERYVDPAYQGPIHAFHAEYRIAIERGEYDLTPADVEQIRNLYYAGVEQADAMIGEVIDELERQGVLDDTLVIVTSDHGEELGEHGLWEHNWMFQTNLLVPLVMSYPKGLPQGKRIDALVESVDILPTICGLGRIEPPGVGSQDPREWIDGKNLLPLIAGEVERVRDYSFSENGLYASIQDARFKLFVRSKSIDEQAFALAMQGEPERPHLYDLDADPGETQNVIDRHPEDVARLMAALRAWDASMPIRSSEIVESERDKRDVELFQQLGYTESGIGEGIDDARATEHDAKKPK